LEKNCVGHSSASAAGASGATDNRNVTTPKG
jgi:hypothetical protein